MRQIFLFVSLLIGLIAHSLDIPKGTFYFDNTKTCYENVKFVYGSDTRNETYVVSMTKDGDFRWKITIEQNIIDMYRYTFAETALPDGKIEKTFPTVKEEISKVYNEKRTATTDKTITPGRIFVPETGDNWAQGNWIALEDNHLEYSGTLPVLFINTENGVAITSKETYVNATYYLDNQNIIGVGAIGSVEQQLPLEIRGRGNYTWTGFNKKPYRIKLGEKQNILGMNKSRHFALLAHADDNLAFLRNTVGFELSRRLGLDYTPEQQPVEVVLNGDYIGLYFLTETIRVDKDRVNIVEQADYATDASEITGGWLVEIDNYDETEQVRITEGNGEVIRFTYKTPEFLSSQQRDYLTEQVTSMDKAIYVTNKNSTEWEEYIDIESLARFYIIQEIMDNAESFHGSCYMTKEQGDATKWNFGPVWDFGNSYHRSSQEFIYQNPPFGQTWIGEIAKFPRFQAKVRELWRKFKVKDDEYAGLEPFISDFCNQINIAAQYNYRRWSEYGNSNIESAKNEFNNYLANRIAWLVGKWGDGEAGIEDVKANGISVSFVSGIIGVFADKDILSVEIFDISGKIMTSENPMSTEWSHNDVMEKGIYLVTARTATDVVCSKIIVR